MNGWEAARLQPRTMPLLLLLIGALLIGIAVPREPVLAFAGVIGVSISLFAIIFPIGTGYLLLVLSAISIQYIFEIEAMGLDLQSFYKFGIILLSVPAMIRFGIHKARLAPIAAVFLICALTYTMADRHPMLSSSAPLVTLIGMTAPFIFLLIRWPRNVTERHVKLLCLLPAVSVAFGAVFHLAGLYPMFVTEYNGAFRLQGANIPPHLAFLAFVAFFVSMVGVKRYPRQMSIYYFLMGTNFVIMLLTGTRGALVAALAMVLAFAFDLLKQFLKGKTALIVPLIGFVAILALSVGLQMDNLKKRSYAQQSNAEVNLSGRSEAWEFFLNGAKESPWFGRGLGSVLVSNDGSIDKSFSVPHNEYIRFYYDGGIVGAALLFRALLIVFLEVYRRASREIRIYLAAFLLGFAVYSISDNTISSIQFIVPFCVSLNAIANQSDPSRRSPI
ncbi:O-antigen ligase family protein [Cohnella sp.]|uniref:O-antigen ligase family protein n=1 Tax=Cohnella sp. TaxID=1883426 RepID=UPI003562FD3A